MDYMQRALRLQDDFYERGDVVFEELRNEDPEAYFLVIAAAAGMIEDGIGWT
jgi:hypothetical protein